MNENNGHKNNLDSPEVLSRRDYQEILLAKMAGGDMRANEIRMKLRKVDMMLDVFREVPLYRNKKM